MYQKLKQWLMWSRKGRYVLVSHCWCIMLALFKQMCRKILRPKYKPLLLIRNSSKPRISEIVITSDIEIKNGLGTNLVQPCQIPHHCCHTLCRPLITILSYTIQLMQKNVSHKLIFSVCQVQTLDINEPFMTFLCHSLLLRFLEEFKQVSQLYVIIFLAIPSYLC